MDEFRYIKDNLKDFRKICESPNINGLKEELDKIKETMANIPNTNIPKANNNIPKKGGHER